MSATQDKTQKIAFVYSNLYTLYKKGKEAAIAAPNVMPSAAPFGLTRASLSALAPNYTSGKVLKTENLAQAKVNVTEFRPAEFIAKRVETVREPLRVAKPEVIQNHALNDLKKNLKNLNDLHARLQFMLKELEDLVKE